MRRVQLAAPARVAISRESMWLVSAHGRATQRDRRPDRWPDRWRDRRPDRWPDRWPDRRPDRRGQLALSAYAVYPVTWDARDFNAVVEPVLRALASSRSQTVLVLTEVSASFDAARTRAAVRSARDIGIASMVEISGEWTPTMLAVLASSAPAYVRLAPPMLRGAASVPETFRSLVLLGEFARSQAMEVVARNPHDAADLDAIRTAGIELVQWASLPDEVSEPSLTSDWATRDV